MGSTWFRNPQALSSALALARAPQARAFGFLNHIDPLASVPNYYLALIRFSKSVLATHAWFLHGRSLSHVRVHVPPVCLAICCTQPGNVCDLYCILVPRWFVQCQLRDDKYILFTEYRERSRVCCQYCHECRRHEWQCGTRRVMLPCTQ